ncbi:MAG: transcriptional regulator [Phaeodactylibacter sp.]|uniref:helix-turn-helix transcriptional regulator n=1 Tax=Phaeodactylibacter sp. TaxID=1940289 RepID=UPI0032F0954E
MNKTTETAVYRVFKLIRLLNSTPRRSARQLAQLLNTSESTLYRHLDLLEDLGYPVETDAYDRKFLQFQFEKGGKSVLEPDELFFLQDHLQQTASDTPEAQAILHKFNLNLSMIPIADALPQLHASRILQLIRTGIETGSCIALKNYQSLSSDTVSDRRVEPLELTSDYRYLIGWDLDKDRQSQFKIARITDIHFLDQKVQPQRVASPTDLFGLTGDKWMDVKLKLSNLAHHLLVEEFSHSRPYIKRRRDGVFFEGQVRNWKGIGRFVLGLPGEIEVVQPEAFREYLRKRVKGWQY